MDVLSDIIPLTSEISSNCCLRRQFLLSTIEDSINRSSKAVANAELYTSVLYQNTDGDSCSLYEF